jgi:hypothetical protein
MEESVMYQILTPLGVKRCDGRKFVMECIDIIAADCISENNA